MDAAINARRKTRSVKKKKSGSQSSSKVKSADSVSLADVTPSIQNPVSAKDRAEIARQAFKAKDLSKTKSLHNTTSVEKHKNLSFRGADYIKSIIYGGMDGIGTTFAVVAAVVGGGLTYGVVLILGFANVLADGVSMGFGDFVSGQAELEFVKAERTREMYECESYIEGERREMVELYSKKKGISVEEAETIVAIISKDYDTFVDIMMVEELGMLPPDPDESPAKQGIVTFLSFLVVGTVPLIPYVVYVIIDKDHYNDKCYPSEGAFISSIILTALALFGLGAMTKNFSTRPWWKAGAFTFVNGAISAVSSYFIAWGISAAAGVNNSP